VVADAAQMHRQSRAPAAGAEDRDPGAHARAPTRRSVPVRTRARLDRWRKTISAAAAEAAMTTANGLPVAYAMAGSVTVASTEPSEMYFVIQTPTTKM